MFDWHRTAAEVDVLSTRYRIDPSEPQAIPDKLRGHPVADHLQERVTALHKAAALSTAPEVTESTREHYAASAAERSAAARSGLLAAAEGVYEATSKVAGTLTDVVTETATETIPKPSTAEAAPATPAGTETTPVAAASPTTAQEGTLMSDPIDETLEHLGRHAGRTGQTIASEVARQIQRGNDDRRRTAQDAQRRADRLAASNGTPIAAEVPAAGLTRSERERRLLEGAGFDPDKRATPEEIRAREEKRRAEHRDTTQTRGDEGLER